MEKKYFNFSNNNYLSNNNNIFNYITDVQNVKYIKISSIEIPNYFINYSDTRNNNIFQIIYDSTTYNVNIGNSTYTLSELETKINSELATINIDSGQDFNFSINSVTKKSTIINNSSNEFNVNFAHTEQNKEKYTVLGKYLGFKELIYNDITTITSESMALYTDDNFIYIKINDIQNLINKDNYYFSKILMIPETITATNNYINYENKGIIGNIYYFRILENLSRIKISFYDCFNDIINLEPYNWSISIEVGYIYDASKIKSIGQDYFYKLE